ncbi:MAG TPA: two-component sensor histidine kinase [Clostridiales bacterium]|nr:two-component sensor histidine kinase [Clostridiales bacterium]
MWKLLEELVIVLRRKLSKNLSAKIFILTLIILLGAGAITFGFIALVTPITYTSVMTSDLDYKAKELIDRLNNSTYEEAIKLVDKFVVSISSNMVVFTPNDEVDNNMPSIEIVEGETNFFKMTVKTRGDESKLGIIEDVSSNEQNNNVDNNILKSYDTVTISNNDESKLAVGYSDEYTYNSVHTAEALTYNFELSDKPGEYTLQLFPEIKPVNQAVLSLIKIAPWLLGCMLLFSFICAYFYSGYITKPIVRLSKISQKMAHLDFTYKCNDIRIDEIGLLGKNLDELSTRLSNALDDLRQSNEALQKDINLERELEQQRLSFFSAVSHELKTPVTILKGQLTGMLEGIDVYKDHDKYLARALMVTSRMENLIQEILMVTKMESRDFISKQESINLGSLLDDCLIVYKELLEQKHIRLSMDVEKNVYITGDIKLLHKVIDNILCNAIFYSPEGANVDILMQKTNEQIVMTIENSGTSIPEESFEHLFEAFYRVEKSRNRSTGGSGLGLYLVKLILDKYDTKYLIENTNNGVRFTIIFS